MYIGFRQKVYTFLKKSTIVLEKKYYRFGKKVLSFWIKSTIILGEKYYHFERKVPLLEAESIYFIALKLHD